MKSQPIPNTSFCSIAQFPVLTFSFAFLLNWRVSLKAEKNKNTKAPTFKIQYKPVYIESCERP